jgi:hypothetical protein
MVAWKKWKTYYTGQNVARRVCSLLNDFKNDLSDEDNQEIWESIGADAMDKILELATANINRFKPIDLAMSIHRLAHISKITNGLDEWLQNHQGFLNAWIATAIGELGRFNPQDLANSIWALATLNHNHQGFANAWIDTATGKLGRFNPQDLSNSIWALSKLRVNNKQLVDDLFNQLKAQVGYFNNYEGKINSMLDLEMARHEWHDSQRLSKAGKQLEEKADADNVEEEGSAKDNQASSSLSDSSSNTLGGSSIKANTAELSSQQSMAMDYLSNDEQCSHTTQQAISSVDNNKDDSTAKNLFMKLFDWFADLPIELQPQKLMQRFIKILEATNPYKFFTINNNAIEEISAADCKKHYGHDDIESSLLEECAHITQDDLLAAVFSDKAEVILSNEILIDPLPKHDTDLHTHSPFENIIS